MRVRKAVSSEAAADDIAVYAEGVRLMKKRSDADQMDPLGWFYQSRIHGNPRATERKPGEPEDWSSCQHGTWFFLPWHRMYLVQFERIIASLTGQEDFALPYWDYPSATDAVIPPAFLDEASPLFDDSRDFQTNPLPAQTWLRTGTFVALGGVASAVKAHRGPTPGALEQNPHNPVHGFVGGDMATYQSPLDPLFWIHHCNIDRLWDVWLQQRGRTNPEDKAWTGMAFDFPDPGPTGRRELRVGEVGTPQAQGYEYDDVTPPADLRDDAATAGRRMLAPMAEPPPRRDDRLEPIGASRSGGSVEDRVEVELVPRATEQRRAATARRMPAADALETADAADAADIEPEGLFLRLENVGMERGDASSMWNVFVSTGGGEPHLVGVIAPFGLAGLTESGGRQTLTFDVSHLADELLADDTALEVTFEAARTAVEGRPFFERAALYTTTD